MERLSRRARWNLDLLSWHRREFESVQHCVNSPTRIRCRMLNSTRRLSMDAGANGGNTTKTSSGAVDTQLQNHCRKRRKTMLRVLVAIALAVAVAPVLCAASRDTGPTPLIKSVQPDSAKPGDEVTVSGTNLARNAVAAVYLTQGDKTIKVKVTSQEETEVKFLVPQDLKAGRFGIMVLTTGGDDAREIDEPVALSVEQSCLRGLRAGRRPLLTEPALPAFNQV